MSTVGARPQNQEKGTLTLNMSFLIVDTYRPKAKTILPQRPRRGRASMSKPPPRACLSHPAVELSAVKDVLKTLLKCLMKA